MRQSWQLHQVETGAVVDAGDEGKKYAEIYHQTITRDDARYTS